MTTPAINKTEKFEMVFAIVGLMFFIGVFSIGGDFNIPDIFLTLIRYGVLGIAVILLCQRWRTSLQVILKGGWIWGLVGLLCFSFLWTDSANLGIVVENIRAEVIPSVCFSIYVASRFTLKQQFTITCWGLGLTILVCALLALGLPSVGVHQNGAFAGAWRGVFSQKNEFGAYTVLTATAFFIKAISQRSQRCSAWTLFSLMIVCVLISNSKTSLLLSIVSILIAFTIYHFQWLGKKTVLLVDVLILILGSIAVFLVNNWEPFLASLDRDPTLSARTLIWTFLIEDAIPKRALLGYGRSIFWEDPQYSLGIEAVARHIPAHAHNGFLDLILDIGLLGLAFFSIALISTYVKAVKLACVSKDAAYLWPAVFLTLMILFNVTESYLTRLTYIFWVMFLAIAFRLNATEKNSTRA